MAPLTIIVCLALVAFYSAAGKSQHVRQNVLTSVGSRGGAAGRPFSKHDIRGAAYDVAVPVQVSIPGSAGVGLVSYSIPCFVKVMHEQSLAATGRKNLFIPVCEQENTSLYKPAQCGLGLDPLRCYCVAANDGEVLGDFYPHANSKCECAREQQLLGKSLGCTPTGDFPDIPCHVKVKHEQSLAAAGKKDVFIPACEQGNPSLYKPAQCGLGLDPLRCNCVAANNGEILGDFYAHADSKCECAREQQLRGKRLGCTLTGDFPGTPCDQKLRQAQSLAAAGKKGVYFPACEQRNSSLYKPAQCGLPGMDPLRCYCVAANNDEVIGDYHPHADSDCVCPREELLRGTRLRCTMTGEYAGTPCDEKLRNTQILAAAGRKGVFFPVCEQGNPSLYKPAQCGLPGTDPLRCYCVAANNGEFLEGYHPHADSKCECARHQVLFGKLLRCTLTGDFAGTPCYQKLLEAQRLAATGKKGVFFPFCEQENRSLYKPAQCGLPGMNRCVCTAANNGAFDEYFRPRPDSKCECARAQAAAAKELNCKLDGDWPDKPRARHLQRHLLRQH